VSLCNEEHGIKVTTKATAPLFAPREGPSLSFQQGHAAGDPVYIPTATRCSPVANGCPLAVSTTVRIPCRAARHQHPVRADYRADLPYSRYDELGLAMEYHQHHSRRPYLPLCFAASRRHECQSSGGGSKGFKVHLLKGKCTQ
jgi:hypothetical protein